MQGQSGRGGSCLRPLPAPFAPYGVTIPFE